MIYDFLIVGAGLSGAVMAERIATQLNKKVLIVDKRSHIGGNAYDELDSEGILIHKYGPHIFHTNSKTIFDYLSKFTDWNFYEHKVLANHKGELYPIPINMITINKYFGKNFETENDVKIFLEELREKKNRIENSEDIIIEKVGGELYEIFFKHYTYKQWNKFPNELAPSVCGRIPVRSNGDCRYFTDEYQFMPRNGYTKMFENMLNHKNIELVLDNDYKQIANTISWEKMIYTGPIDYYFDYKFAKLPHRSIRFEYENLPVQIFQEAAQINYLDPEIPFTRVIEHKYLSKQKSNCTTISREYPQQDGEPFYPIPASDNRKLYLRYKEESKKIKNVYFCGRLAEYQYYNMDQVVANTLKMFVGIANG